MATKFGTKLAITRLAQEIFAPIGGFSRMAIECCQLRFSPTDPRCHGNESWDKMGYNLACVRNFCEIFAPIGRFSGMGHRMLPIAFSPIDCRYYLNHKIGWGLGRGQRPFPRKIKM